MDAGSIINPKSGAIRGKIAKTDFKEQRAQLPKNLLTK